MSTTKKWVFVGVTAASLALGTTVLPVLGGMLFVFSAPFIYFA